MTDPSLPFQAELDHDGLSMRDIREGSPSEVEAIRQHYRQKARKSLYWFSKVVVGHTDMVPHVHLELCNNIQDPLNTRELTLMPRGGLKSSVTTVAYPPWLQIQEPDGHYFFGPDERILIGNASAINASKFLIAIESIYEANYLFRWLFYELIPNYRKVPWSGEAMRINRNINTPTESIEAMGVGSRVTGRHYTKIILDDLVEKEASESETTMRRTINWYKYTHSLLENPERDKMIVTGTKWCPNEYQATDLYDYIEDKDPEYHIYRRGAYVYDRQGQRQSFWPERFSLKHLEELQRKDPAVFSCQQLNDPLDAKALDFDAQTLKDHLKYWEMDQDRNIWVDGVYEDGRFIKCKRGPKVRDMNIYILFDPAISLDAKACDSAILVVGLDVFHRRLLLNVWGGRRTPEEITDHWLEMQRKYPVYRTVIEAVLFQKLYCNIFARGAKDAGIVLLGGEKHFIAHRPDNRKTPRIRVALRNYIQNDELYVHRTQKKFTEQLGRFPKGKVDYLDALVTGDTHCEFPFPDDPQPDQESIPAYVTGRNPHTGY